MSIFKDDGITLKKNFQQVVAQDLGADGQVPDIKGMPLILAAEKRDMTLAIALLKDGADIDESMLAAKQKKFSLYHNDGFNEGVPAANQRDYDRYEAAEAWLLYNKDALLKETIVSLRAENSTLKQKMKPSSPTKLKP